MASKDYFSFETIRDHERNVICYYVTMIGTIEADGVCRIRTDLGRENNEKMAFGRLTLRNLDKKIGTLLRETDSKVYYHNRDEETGSVDVISFTAKDWRADEVYEFEAGDRVLLQGRAYIRKPDLEKYPNRHPELSVTVGGIFRLGRARKPQRHFLNDSLVPQK